MTRNPLAAAAAAHDADVEALGDMDEDQLYYLSHLDEIADPLSDGIDCDTQVETE
jgi:hypothetical protein